MLKLLGMHFSCGEKQDGRRTLVGQADRFKHASQAKSILAGWPQTPNSVLDQSRCARRV